jgi:hypothetical protein
MRSRGKESRVIAVWSWYAFWLVLHILAVIIAFGPAMAMFPFVATMGQKMPQHAPLAVTVPLSGVGLIYTGHVDFWGSEWLLASTVLFIAAFFFATVVQKRNSGKLLAMVRQMPPGPPPAGAAPPAELVTLAKRLRIGGMYLGASVFVILILMVGGREGWFS